MIPIYYLSIGYHSSIKILNTNINMVKDKNTKNSKSTKASVNKGESKVTNRTSYSTTIITKSNINNSIKEISTIEELINRLRTLKKIIVITGAGIQHQFVLVNFIINSIVKRHISIMWYS